MSLSWKSAALSANSSDTLDDIQREFKAAQGRVRSNLDLLPSNQGANALREAAAKLLALGDGKTGAFSVRQKELDANDYGQTVLDETRKLNIGLTISVQQLVAGVQSGTDASTWQARQEISYATAIMLALGAATLLGSILFVWRYVGGNILRRIRGLQRSMQLLSNGDLDTEIFRSRQNDEIAAMSDTLQVFRDSMIKARALSADQDKDRAAKAERTSRIETRIGEFEATVRAALDNLQKSANSGDAQAQFRLGMEYAAGKTCRSITRRRWRGTARLRLSAMQKPSSTSASCTTPGVARHETRARLCRGIARRRIRVSSKRNSTWR